MGKEEYFNRHEVSRDYEKFAIFLYRLLFINMYIDMSISKNTGQNYFILKITLQNLRSICVIIHMYI